MDPDRLRSLLHSVESGSLSVDDAMGRLEKLPFEDLGYARIDHHRALRQGFPEVVFCEGKTAEQATEISRRIVDSGSTLLATRVHPETARGICDALKDAEYNETSRTVIVRGETKRSPTTGTVLIISAGTSDLPVAEEAAVTAEVMGNRIERIFDVGVSGIHRLFAHHETIGKARVIVVVAGMEGALPSVVGGLVDVPVIAVPTSVGYGASFGGIAALLAMLNCCAPGVAVVNIDNGFGAGMMASLINGIGEG